MKGSHLFWLSRSKGMTVTVYIWIREYNPPRCFQKKISGRGKHNDVLSALGARTTSDVFFANVTRMRR
jgi:hypothetical protein